MTSMTNSGLAASDRSPVLRESLVSDGEWDAWVEAPAAGPFREDSAEDELWERLMRVRNLKLGPVESTFAAC
jgi:hypothetical protein